MAFSDFDIKQHMRKIGLNRASISNYHAIGIPDEKNPDVGKVPHMAELRARNQEIYTLATTRARANGSLMKPLHWARTHEADSEIKPPTVESVEKWLKS